MAADGDGCLKRRWRGREGEIRSREGDWRIFSRSHRHGRLCRRSCHRNRCLWHSHLVVRSRREHPLRDRAQGSGAARATACGECIAQQPANHRVRRPAALGSTLFAHACLSDATAADDGELLAMLRIGELEDPLVDGALRAQLEHTHRPRLPEPVASVHGLPVNSRIEVGVVQNHRVSACEVDAEPTRARREQQHANRSVRRELINDGLALIDLRRAIKAAVFDAKVSEEPFDDVEHGGPLGEEYDAMARGQQRGQQLAQSARLGGLVQHSRRQRVLADGAMLFTHLVELKVGRLGTVFEYLFEAWGHGTLGAIGEGSLAVQRARNLPEHVAFVVRAQQQRVLCGLA